MRSLIVFFVLASFSAIAHGSISINDVSSSYQESNTVEAFYHQEFNDLEIMDLDVRPELLDIDEVARLGLDDPVLFNGERLTLANAVNMCINGSSSYTTCWWWQVLQQSQWM